MRKKYYLCPIFRAESGTTIDVLYIFNKQDERNYKEGFVA